MACGWQVIAGLALCASLVACGGGGGSSPPAFREPPPTLSQDTVPTGARLDLRSSNYFPMGAGDFWTYDVSQNGAVTPNGLQRNVSAGPDATGLVTLTESSAGLSGSAQYRKNDQGVWLVDPFGFLAPDGVRSLVGDLLEIAEPFYPAGAVLETIRQGTWDADLDGDGHPEGFRLEFRRQLVGFETITVPRGTAQTVHWRTVTVLTLYPSLPTASDVSTTGTEDSWWAPGIGLVRSERRIDGDGAQPPVTLTITGGSVAAQPLFPPPVDGTVTALPLVHNDLVFDAGRQRYYASVPGSVAGVGNSIASIDPATGAVGYSAAIGSEPSALGLAADGSVLYVGLNGSGEVVRLALPQMQETGRVRLPNVTFFGQLFAENISVSPVDATVFAVSMWRASVSPRHGGAALVRDMVLQPVMTQDHTGSNLIAFDADGQVVYGFNNETTEFGLRRNLVQADGLVQGLLVSAAAGSFSTRVLESSSRGVMLDRTLYRGADLTQLGQISAGGGCRLLARGDRYACLQSTFPVSGEQRLVVADATTFVTLSTPMFAASTPQAYPMLLVPGPDGQVALRLGNTSWNSSASALWLFNAPALQ